jgi:hypothetical protein
LGRPDVLVGFLEVLHRLVKNGVFVGHDKSIRTGRILRGVDRPGYASGCLSPLTLEEQWTSISRHLTTAKCRVG